MKRLSAAAIVALKDALAAIYWFKKDLKSFLRLSLANPQLVNRLNWDQYKWEVTSDLVDLLCSDQEQFLPDLTRLCFAVVEMDSFRHLQQLDDGDAKVKKAKTAVAHLRTLVASHKDTADEDTAIQERRRRAADEQKQKAAMRTRLAEIRARYAGLVTSANAQQRGFDLERVLRDLFELFDLDPKASFRIVGEQIDGAFSLDNTDYLLEAKWTKDRIDADTLYAFEGKVNRKLENTLGVFLSIEGFSDDGLTAFTRDRPKVILMDGADLMAVVDDRIDFVRLLQRKKRHAAQTGQVFLPIRDITD